MRYLLGKMDVADAALVCAGDDTTDEDMFDILRWEISIKVGSPRNTRARFYVPGVPQLLDFLTVLAAGSPTTTGAYPPSVSPPGLQLPG